MTLWAYALPKTKISFHERAQKPKFLLKESPRFVEVVFCLAPEIPASFTLAEI